MLCVDFNRQAQGKERRYLENPEEVACPASLASCGPLFQALEDYIEIDFDLETNFHAATRSLAQIVRVFVGTEAWLLKQSGTLDG